MQTRNFVDGRSILSSKTSLTFLILLAYFAAASMVGGVYAIPIALTALGASVILPRIRINAIGTGGLLLVVIVLVVAIIGGLYYIIIPALISKPPTPGNPLAWNIQVNDALKGGGWPAVSASASTGAGATILNADGTIHEGPLAVSSAGLVTTTYQYTPGQSYYVMLVDTTTLKTAIVLGPITVPTNTNPTGTANYYSVVSAPRINSATYTSSLNFGNGTVVASGARVMSKASTNVWTLTVTITNSAANTGFTSSPTTRLSLGGSAFPWQPWFNIKLTDTASGGDWPNIAFKGQSFNSLTVGTTGYKEIQIPDSGISYQTNPAGTPQAPNLGSYSLSFQLDLTSYTTSTATLTFQAYVCTSWQYFQSYNSQDPATTGTSSGTAISLISGTYTLAVHQ